MAALHEMDCDHVSKSECRHKPRQFGDAGPLGLSAFAFTTFLMALINLSVGGVTVPNIIIGPAMIYGGLGQLLAGMWDMANGETLRATIAASYGCFWMSFAITLLPFFRIEDAYSDIAEFNHAMGLFMMGFFIFSLAVTMCSVKGTFPFLGLTILVNFTWLFLSVANLHTTDSGQPDPVFKKLGGVFGLLVALTAWYNMYVGMATKSNSFVVPPELQVPWSRKRL